MGRPLKRNAEYAAIPGVGMPKSLRISLNRVYSFSSASGAATGMIFLNLLNPVADPIFGTTATPATTITNMSDPIDWTRFVNSQLYRKGAVYATSVRILARNSLLTTGEALVFMAAIPGGDTLATTPDIPGFPINLSAMAVADASEYIRANPDIHYEYLQVAANGRNMCEMFRELESAEELGVKKELIYDDDYAFQMTFNAGTPEVEQPVNGNANNKLWLVFGDLPVWVNGSDSAVNTPASPLGATVTYDLQVTYHMLLFNDVANDLGIADPAAPAPEEGTTDAEEWSDADTGKLTLMLNKLNTSNATTKKLKKN